MPGRRQPTEGLSDLATHILGRQVRIGRPLGIGGLTEATRGPTFAAAGGLLVDPQFAYLEHCEPRRTRALMTGTDGYFTRVVVEGGVLRRARSIRSVGFEIDRAYRSVHDREDHSFYPLRARSCAEGNRT